ncbi:MAG: helix-turn-helix domain-containing protein [Firmicutes bacterium]|nr:helix-turn-helix domain-containing protein [Bacillota bacterium]
MEREELLKAFILSKYKSLRAFAVEAGIPYMTISNMLKRGLGNSSATNVIEMCQFLGIDFESLFNGKVVEKEVDKKIGNVWDFSPSDGTPHLQTNEGIGRIMQDLAALPPEALGEAHMLIELLKYKHTKERD